MHTEITEKVARKVLSVVDRGLSSGVGVRKPGQMCVEAAVCYALGLPHGDDPACVSRALRSLKINLNDRTWSSNKARASGLRRLAVAQLGSYGHLDDIEFIRRVAELAIRTCVPQALRSAASIHKDPTHVQALRDAANKCEREPTEKNSRKAQAAAAAANAAAAYVADAAYAAAYAAATAANAYATAATATAAAAYAADAAAYADDAYAAYAAYAAHAAAVRFGFCSAAADKLESLLKEAR